MPDNVKVTAKRGYGCYEKTTERTGRLIGLANEKECRAIINLKDGARRASTHGNKSIDDIYDDPHIYESRFVLVFREAGLQKLFISPKIRSKMSDTLQKGFICCDDSRYVFEMIEEKEKKQEEKCIL